MTKFSLRRAVAVVVSLAVALSACGDDDDGSSGATAETTAETGGTEPTTDDGGGEGEEVRLSLQVGDDGTAVAQAEALTAGFTELNPNITFDIETRPGGTEGDNIVKTRLSTGEMTDVFFYNSGSLLQALNPEETLVDLTGDPVLDNVVDDFLPTVTQNGKVFGVPVGTGFGGGILYNQTIFEEHGLEIPLTWEEFAANNEKLKEAGVTPVGASFGDTWTSQLFVLADYYNVLQAEPNFTEEYTANQAKYATTPAALAGFQHLQEAFDKGWWNEDFGAALFEDAQAMLLDGEIAQYPMLTFAVPGLASIDPEKAKNVGFFAQPGPDAEANGMTLWMPGGAYIAATSDHPEEAKQFLAFIASVDGTETLTAATEPAGPYLIEGATLPEDVLPAVKDVEAYLLADKVSPALEFVSPVKGPNLENITVEVGSGLRSAEDGAALYDEDVEKQSQQLGLPGW
jgi:raffinose/stachyose/melibiose transport system substrate-binding protein